MLACTIHRLVQPFLVTYSVYSFILLNVKATVERGALYPCKQYMEDIEFNHIVDERGLIVGKCQRFCHTKSNLQLKPKLLHDILEPVPQLVKLTTAEALALINSEALEDWAMPPIEQMLAMCTHLNTKLQERDASIVCVETSHDSVFKPMPEEWGNAVQADCGTLKSMFSVIKNDAEAKTGRTSVLLCFELWQKLGHTMMLGSQVNNSASDVAVVVFPLIKRMADTPLSDILHSLLSWQIRNSECRYTIERCTYAPEGQHQGVTDSDLLVVTILKQVAAKKRRRSDPVVPTSYCTCAGPATAVMIQCADSNCETKIYHLHCVGLDALPHESQAWQCASCVFNEEECELE
eukprot:6577-Heterococcus_DN1.PRE.7